MGIKKGVGMLVLLILFVIPTIIALDTEITVKTQPSYAVSIRVLNIDGSGTLKDPYPSGAFLDQIANENGEAIITYSSEIVNKVDISLMIKNSVGGNPIQFEGGPVQLINNNGEHMKAGWPIKIDTIANPPVLIKSGNPSGVEETNTTEEVSNETTTGNEINVEVEIEEPELQENTEEIEAETKSGITGKAISGIKNVATSKTTYYVVGALVLVFVIIFIIKKKDDFKGGKGNPFSTKKDKGKKDDDKKGDDKKEGESMTERQELEDAEKKLEEAKKELEDVRNKDDKEEKIRTIKARFERDKAALEELEKE